MSRRLAPDQERLVNEHIEFAQNLSWKFARKYNLAQEETLSLAYLGLVQAASRFDPSSGVPFASFAYTRIHGSIIDEIRRQDPRTRSEVARGAPKPEFFYIDAPYKDSNDDGHDITDLAKFMVDNDTRLDFRRNLAKLDNRSQEILVSLAAGIPGVELGKMYGVTESRISQIASKARIRLEEMMAG